MQASFDRNWMNPLVSILIPAYNAERFIADTIRSALGQTWPNKEIIIVDDGSKDQTLAVARQFASNSVTVATQPNAGASAARNKAFSLSRGDYIQWLDADDLLSPDKIAQQVEVLNQGLGKRMLLSSGWGYFLYRPHGADFTPTPLWCDLTPVEWLLRKMGHNLHMQPGTWLVSRQLTEAAGPWDVRLSLDDDGEYFCRVLLASEGVRFVPEGRTYYRVSGFGSLSSVNRSSKKLQSQILSMEMHLRYLRSLEDSPRTRSACLAYLATWLPIFYPERMDLVGRIQQWSADLGGSLPAPTLSWKYRWMQKLFGWKFTRRAQLVFPRCRRAVARSWDKTLLHLERLGLAGTENAVGQSN